MDSFSEVMSNLECYHGVFAQVWSMGHPQFTDEIDTAAVSFDKSGGFVSFLFNEEFYNKLSMDEKCAIVAHECLHVILNHGKRGQKMVPEIANVAMDVVINELLVDKFGFKRDLPVFENCCFLDNVFKNRDDVLPNQSFEYYYAKMMENVKIINMMGLMDDHSDLPQDAQSVIQDAASKLSDEEVDSFVDKMNGSGESKADTSGDDEDKKSDEESKKSKDSQGKKQDGGRKAGTGSGFSWIIKKIKRKVLKKWEQIIKDFVIKAWQNKDKDNWVRTSRRYSIVARNNGFLLPTTNECDELDMTRVDVVLFMDVSGSCHGQSEKFFTVANSIPMDKFLVDAYAFDTGITKVDLSKDRLPYGGGTSFDQLERMLAQRKSYPTLVFMLTDGYGTPISPKYPERWHVFLTHDYKACLHRDMKIHKFEDLK